MAIFSFDVLGPVVTRVDGEPVDLGYAKQRTVLALLAVDAGLLLPADRLIRRVWGEDPPPTARNLLYGHIARLRRVLPRGRHSPLRRRSGGYVLDVSPETVDLHRFRHLMAQARVAGGAIRAGLIRRGLDLWRGQALAGTDGPWSSQMAAALDSEHLAARLELIELEQASVSPAELAAQLAALAAQYPTHEGVAAQLMMALHRAGWTAAALERYAFVRQRLAAEIGVDPGAALRDLHQRILRQDPTLDAVPPL